MDDDDWANSAEMDALMAAAEAKPPPPPRTVSSKQLCAVLKDKWGYAEFRAGQEEAVERACAGCDVAVYWPTGSGKSLVYQVPALLRDGMCVGHLAARVAHDGPVQGPEREERYGRRLFSGKRAARL